MIYADRPSDSPVMVKLSEPGEDRELKAIAYIGSVLTAFNDDERERILNYLCERFPKIRLAEIKGAVG